MRTNSVNSSKLSDCKSALENLLSKNFENNDADINVTTKQAISDLYPVLHELQQRGYNTEKLAGKLSEYGISITESTLRNYLTHAKKIHKPKTKRIQRPPKPKTQKPTTEATKKPTLTPAKTAISGQMNIVPDDDDI